MPGSPLKTRVKAALKTRAAAALGEEGTTLEYACQYIAAGGRITQLAQEIAREIGHPVSRPFLSGILNGLSDEASERLATARRDGATALVEETAQLADDAEPTTAGIQKAGLQIKTRQWIAERFDPQTFGPKGALVNVSVGSLMLAALRQPPPPRPDDLEAHLIHEPEVETISDE